MLRSFLLYFLVLLCGHISRAQKLVLSEPAYPGDLQPFGRCFVRSAYVEATLKSRETFREKHVRKINIYDSRNTLVYCFELDQHGKTLEEGGQNDYFFWTLRRQVEYLDTFECRTWREEGIIMRKDTFVVRHKTYRHADTLMDYDEYSVITYKRGKLINTQNDFYALKYLNHAGSLKDDYDSGVLYTCSKQQYRVHFSASVKHGKIFLDTNTLREHPFFNAYRQQAVHEYFVEGEDFVEPWLKTWSCGTVLPSREPHQTLNDKGLFDKQYSDESENTLMFYARYEYYKTP